MSPVTQSSLRVGGLTFDVAGVSEQGPRKENQDAFSLDRFRETGLLAVADGMGGERGGRIAAETALRALVETAPIRSLDAARHAVRAADQAVALSAQEDPGERAGMGCALALLALAPARGGHPGWVGAYVGDVRILSRSPDGTVRLESRDHTPAYARWEAGEIGMDEIPDSPGANKLQRAVGRGGEADAVWVPLRAGWSYLLVSDGISKATRLDELGEAMAAPSAGMACETIVRRVEERGPDDNYTVIAVRVVADGEDATDPAPPAPAGPPRSADSPVFNPVAPVTRPRSSPWTAVAVLLALAALALAGWALWSGMQARQHAAARTELERLRAQVDSLGQRLPPADTMIPLTQRAAPAPAASTVPAPQTPARP